MDSLVKRFLSLGIIAVLSLWFVAVVTAQSVWQPAPGSTWQWQISGDINTSYDVDMYDIDLFDTPQSTINALKARGVIVICYFSAGSHENWRPDAGLIPAHIIGKKLDGWAGERWLNIADIPALSSVMMQRLDLAAVRGCDGVEPDNVDGYTNNTGFPLTYNDQINYGIWLAEQAHSRGLSIGLKNNLNQVNDLLPYYNWALNEQCFQYKECDLLLPFVQAGKAVFGVEYELKQNKYCPTAIAYNFSWLHKTYDLGNEAPNACTGDTPTVTVIPKPTDTPVVTPEPTDTPVVTSEPTDVPVVTPEPTDAPVVTPEPTATPSKYDKKGYDAEGYNAEGYNKKGYNREGYNKEGYDKKGYDREGYNKKGYDSAGYDREGYNKKGYDRDGYDEEGYDKKGYDRDGFDENGCTKKSCD